MTALGNMKVMNSSEQASDLVIAEHGRTAFGPQPSRKRRKRPRMSVPVSGEHHERPRAATEGDPSSVYHEAAQLRAALRDLIGNAECRCDHPLVTEPCSKCRATAVLNAS